MSDKSPTPTTTEGGWISTVITCERVAEMHRIYRGMVDAGKGGESAAEDLLWACREIEKLRNQVHDLKGNQRRLINSLVSFGQSALNEADRYDI